MPERLECEVLQKEHDINPLTFSHWLPRHVSSGLITYGLPQFNSIIPPQTVNECQAYTYYSSLV